MFIRNERRGGALREQSGRQYNFGPFHLDADQHLLDWQWSGYRAAAQVFRPALPSSELTGTAVRKRWSHSHSLAGNFRRGGQSFQSDCPFAKSAWRFTCGGAVHPDRAQAWLSLRRASRQSVYAIGRTAERKPGAQPTTHPHSRFSVSVGGGKLPTSIISLTACPKPYQQRLPK